jgi:hypothetical protein
MLIAVAVLLTLALIVWLAVRGFRGQPVKAHHVTYGLAVITAVYTVAFFLSMDMPQLFKIVFSILAGVALIFVASTMQRRREEQK